MTRRPLVFPACLLLLAGCARPHAETDGTPLEEASLTQTAPDPAAYTETEERVRALLAADGLHVVHFWAPWCHNSMSEFREGVWPEIIERNEDVTFIFVTVYNDGNLGERTLRQYDIPERVHTFAQPDRGSSSLRANRRRAFLDLPLTWTPATWIFHRNGTLAYAVNYGEVRPALMQALFDNARAPWSRH